MSRKLTALLLAMLVLAGAMGLKAVVASRTDGVVMMANGSAPVPPPSFMRNGSAPVPPPAYRNGSAPVPPPAFRNGSAPVPPPSAR
jgi:hypothetical protein